MNNKVVCSHMYITFIDVIVYSCWSSANICSLVVITSIAKYMNDHVEIFMVYLQVITHCKYIRGNFYTF